MKKYVYDNAVVHIDKPTEEQIQNIHIATERFVKKLVRKGLIRNETRRRNRRTGRNNINAGQGNQKTQI